MEGSCFEVVVKDKENKDINSSGIDNVEFMLIGKRWSNFFTTDF